MRLVRLVVAGILLGAVAGFVAALLRPRSVHRSPSADAPAADPPPLPERGDSTVDAALAAHVGAAPSLDVAEAVEVRG